MSALHRLFGRDDRFFQLLEQSAAEAKNGASHLARVVAQIGHGSIDEAMGDLAQSRRKHKRISQETTEELCNKFATPLEREDIETLSSALYKISKNVEKIGERLTISPPGVNMESIGKQISLLEQSTSIVTKMVEALRKNRQGEQVKDDYERLQGLEGEADRVMNDLLRDIYRGESDARMVVFWKDIYELLEKGIDRCRDVGNVVFHIVLKNS
ncbi:MAG: phosphate transport regulator [Chthoniobacteraceae bacterium]|nr:phosphate transport regulator [Chthoniobacteraceae bacterium]